MRIKCMICDEVIGELSNNPTKETVEAFCMTNNSGLLWYPANIFPDTPNGLNCFVCMVKCFDSMACKLLTSLCIKLRDEGVKP